MSIVKITDCGKGWNADQMPEELGDGVWNRVENMRFRNGFAERFRGMTNVFTTPTITPYYITPYQTVSAKYWVYAGTQKVFADDGTTQTEITPGTAFTGAVDDRWSGGTLSGVLVMNNGVDQPHYWNGNPASDLVVLTGWNTNWRCASLRPFKDYLVALDITKSGTRYPHMVKWSHSSVPGAIPSSWDETDVTKDAGEQDLAQTPDLLVDALPMGDVLIIYKERSMYSMSFIGQPYIWRFTKLPGDSGMLSRGCGVATPVGHVVLTAGDVIIHQAQGVQSIADAQVRKYIFNNIDNANYKKAFVTSNPQKNEVLVCFPSNGSTVCDKAAVWNWSDKTWGLRDLNGVTYGAFGQANITNISTTWDTDSGAWDSDASEWNENEYAPNEARLILCRNTPAITAFDTGTNDFGSNFRGILQRENMSFGDSYSNKLLRTIYPKIDAADGTVIQIEAGSSMNPSESPSWEPAVSFTVGTDQKADILCRGRYLSLRLTSTGASPWRVRSIDLDIVTAGAY